MTSNHLLRARRFLWGCCAALVLVIPLSAASQAALTRTTTQFEALPLVRSRQNHLLVRAFINGRPAWLTVDSGAPVSAIALNRRQYFRLKPITAESSLPARVQINGAFNNVAIARELRIGGLTLVDEPVVTVDLGGSARAARMAHEPQIDGIIGADILFPTQAVLDCEKQLLILKTDPDVVGSFPGFNRRGLRAVPIQVSDGYNLYVNGSVDIIGKEVGVIDLAGLIHDGLLDGSPPVAGLLGAETLRRHHGIIDFGTRTLYLQQRELPWQRSGWRRSAGPNLTF